MNIIIGALSISDPVKSIQSTLNFSHSIKGKVKMVSYVAQGMNIASHQADLYLAELIRSSRYYKNILNIPKSKKFFKQLYFIEIFHFNISTNLMPAYF